MDKRETETEPWGTPEERGDGLNVNVFTLLNRVWPERRLELVQGGDGDLS